MILPNDERCAEVMRELDGVPELTQWETQFVRSNLARTTFTTAQKEAVVRLEEKYDV
jgi:hypothetical protein